MYIVGGQERDHCERLLSKQSPTRKVPLNVKLLNGARGRDLVVTRQSIINRTGHKFSVRY